MTEINGEEESRDGGATKGEAGYCVCNKPATAPNTMINCRECGQWFHISCVLPEDSDATLITKYICEECHQKSGNQTRWVKGGGKGKKNKRKQDETHIDVIEKKENQSPKKARENPNTHSTSPQEKKQPKQQQEPVRRSARNKIKHNYCELNDGAEQEEADKSIVIDYVKMLKKANYVKSDSIPHKMKGEDLTLAYLSENGFREPLLVDGMEALDMKMPPSSITVNRIKELVGANRPLDVMEVPTQAEVDPKWTMEQWAEYYHTPADKRQQILNVISLEISKTPLCAQIRTPRIVREIDWIDKVWPHRWKASSKFPQVQVYCLMGVQNAYTDFHIDFGGSSVWYHVIKGKKIFYLIPPEKDNLEKYTTWSSSPRQSKVWFGNLVPKCYEAHVNPGQTFFIPTGWIHAVFTPEDSLVFGGNFLHGLNCRKQLDIYEVETATHVPEKFRFPLFRQMIWFAAKHYADVMRSKGIENLNKWERDSARAIMETLDVWLMDSVRSQKANVPTKVKNPEMVLEDLHRFLDDDENDLKLKISKEEMIRMGAGDILREMGENGIEIKQEDVPVKKKRGPKKKIHLSTSKPNSTSTSPNTSPSSTPSCSPLSFSSTNSTPTILTSSSPAISSAPPPSSIFSQHIFRDERSSIPSPSHSPPSPSLSPSPSSYPFKHYNSAPAYTNGYSRDVYSPLPYTKAYPTTPSQYGQGYASSPYYKQPIPPRPSSASSSVSSSSSSSSSISSSHPFSDLLSLTNAAESVEKEALRDSYARHGNYDAQMDTYRQHYNSYENGNILRSPYIRPSIHSTPPPSRAPPPSYSHPHYPYHPPHPSYHHSSHPYPPPSSHSSHSHSSISSISSHSHPSHPLSRSRSPSPSPSHSSRHHSSHHHPSHGPSNPPITFINTSIAQFRNSTSSSSSPSPSLSSASPSLSSSTSSYPDSLPIKHNNDENNHHSENGLSRQKATSLSFILNSGQSNEEPKSNTDFVRISSDF